MPLRSLTLIALLAGAALTATAPVASAQGASTPQHHGPRYCPELAGTDNAYRVVCPSWEVAVPVSPRPSAGGQAEIDAATIGSAAPEPIRVLSFDEIEGELTGGCIGNSSTMYCTTTDGRRWAVPASLGGPITPIGHETVPNNGWTLD